MKAAMVIPKDHIFHTIGALANHYGVSRETVKRRIKDGTLKVYRFAPRSVRIKLSDAEKHSEARRNTMATGKLNIENAQRTRTRTISEHVKALVAAAPPLTVEQGALIRAQLGPLPQPAHQAVAA